jgi:cobalt-zinc-cadmium efflux system outer membrane protein
MAQAELSSFAARYALDSAAWQVRSNLRSALIELTAARRRDELLHNQLTNQARMTELLQQRLEAGAASASELLPARLGLVRLQSDAASARTAFLQARSHLAEAIGIPETRLNGAHFRFEETTNNTLVSRTPELRALALQRRSNILSALAKYEASQAALQLEIAKQYPDIRLGSGYVWDQGESKWNLLLSMEIPLLNRNEGPIAEAEARRTEAAAQLVDVQARAIAEIDRTLSILAGSAEEIARISQVHATTSEEVTLGEQRLAAGAADQVEVQTLRIEESASALLLLDAQTRLKVAGGQLEDALQIPFKALAAVVPNIPMMKPQVAGGAQ